jgi:hypothetical protein
VPRHAKAARQWSSLELSSIATDIPPSNNTTPHDATTLRSDILEYVIDRIKLTVPTEPIQKSTLPSTANYNPIHHGKLSQSL